MSAAAIAAAAAYATSQNSQYRPPIRKQKKGLWSRYIAYCKKRNEMDTYKWCYKCNAYAPIDHGHAQ